MKTNPPKTSDRVRLERLEEIFFAALEQAEENRDAFLDQACDGDSQLRTFVSKLLHADQDPSHAIDPAPWTSGQIATGMALAERPTLSGYTILSELGTGGMGVVYLARRDRLGGRPVALKVLPPALAYSASARRRFLAEAHALAKLHHPNIVTIHDVIDESGIVAYAMEWIDGVSLQQVIEQRLVASERSRSRAGESSAGTRFGPGASYTTFICRVGKACAEALGVVHGAGLLHRDIKPSNILIRENGEPVLTDFGVVHDQEATLHTKAGEFIGTPAYAAPEQLRGDQHRVDARTDVYGLGITLYHALALQRPFDGSSTASILNQIESGLRPTLRRIRPRVSRDLDTIITKAIDPVPGHRYPSAEEFADDLKRLLNLHPVHARPVGYLRRLFSLCRRNRRLLAGVISGSVLSVVLGGLLVFYAFIAPDWAAREIHLAQQENLKPEFTTQLFIRLYGSIDEHEVSRDVLIRRLDTILEHYTTAMRLRPWDASLRRERAIVVASRARVEKLAPAEGSLHLLPPLTVEYLSPMDRTACYDMFRDEQFANADTEDLRLLGIAAWLNDDILTCLRAWPRLDAQAGNMPFVEAALGYLYLLLEYPQLAYPRLQMAAEAYPSAGFLHVYLAEAAILCGDVLRGEIILEQAARMEDPDPMNALPRVRALLLDKLGRTEEAIALYGDEFNHLSGNPLALTHYADLLERTSGIEAGLKLLAQRQYDIHMMRSFQLFYVDMCERWWSELDEEEKHERLNAARRSASEIRFLLEHYAHARSLLVNWPDLIRPALNLPDGRAEYATERAAARRELDHICGELGLPIGPDA